MKQDKNNFRHESLQDLGSLKEIMQSITRSIGKGKLVISDEDGEICLKPGGLLNLKITASQDESRDRLNIRITWQKPVTHEKGQKHLKITEK